MDRWISAELSQPTSEWFGAWFKGSFHCTFLWQAHLVLFLYIDQATELHPERCLRPIGLHHPNKKKAIQSRSTLWWLHCLAHVKQDNPTYHPVDQRKSVQVGFSERVQGADPEENMGGRVKSNHTIGLFIGTSWRSSCRFTRRSDQLSHVSVEANQSGDVFETSTESSYDMPLICQSSMFKISPVETSQPCGACQEWGEKTESIQTLEWMSNHGAWSWAGNKTEFSWRYICQLLVIGLSAVATTLSSSRTNLEEMPNLCSLTLA